MSTGSELIAPGTPLQPGQIYESNAVMLAAAIRDAGAHVVASPMTGDEVETFRLTLERFAGDADLIITTGGVSAGAYEVVKDAWAALPTVLSTSSRWPCSPACRRGRDTPPVPRSSRFRATRSARWCPSVFIRSPLRAAMGLPRPDRPRRMAVLTETLTSPPGKRQFRRGVLDSVAGQVTSYGPPASHHLRWLASANCLLEIDEDVAEVAAGSQVPVWDLSVGSSP